MLFRSILKHSRKGIIDYVIANIEEVSKSVLEKYKEDGAKPVLLTQEDEKALKKMDIKVIKDNLIDVKKDYIRHDNLKVSKMIFDLANEKNRKRAYF